jgi:hypothetical protein
VIEKGDTVYVFELVKLITGFFNVSVPNSGTFPMVGVLVDTLDNRLEELLIRKAPTVFANGLELPV